MTLRVAITRTAPDSGATAERVQAMRAVPVLAPLLTIESAKFDPSIDGAQALLFTSGNGVRAFSQANPQARQVPVISVGDATADVARASGFANVISASGDVHALIGKVRRALKPHAGKLIHFSGAHLSGDLVGALRAAGYDAERRVAYEAKAVETLPPALNQPLDIVLFHSARAAERFVALGAPNADKLTAACISEAVAQAAGKARWARIIVSPAPREDALLREALVPDSPAGASA